MEGDSPSGPLTGRVTRKTLSKALTIRPITVRHRLHSARRIVHRNRDWKRSDFEQGHPSDPVAVESPFLQGRLVNCVTGCPKGCPLGRISRLKFGVDSALSRVS